MRNRFPGTCYRCGDPVQKGEGHFEKSKDGWKTQHASCAIKYRGTAQVAASCVDKPPPQVHDDPVLSGEVCPYCGCKSIITDSAEVYHGKSFGPIHLCRKCKAWVGCHRGTTVALGRLADEPLRKMKQKFHLAFDPIWKEGRSSRSELYGWLAGKMGIEENKCHGGMFSMEQCKKAIAILKTWGKAPVKNKTEHIVTLRAQNLVRKYSDHNGSGTHITTCTARTCTHPLCSCT